VHRFTRPVEPLHVDHGSHRSDGGPPLALRLDALGLQHSGVHRASANWMLPALHDPDGHEVRFYTHAEHEDAPTGPHRVHDPGPNMRIEPLPG
jgi:hypothetical protein